MKKKDAFICNTQELVVMENEEGKSPSSFSSFRPVLLMPRSSSLAPVDDGSLFPSFLPPSFFHPRFFTDFISISSPYSIPTFFLSLCTHMTVISMMTKKMLMIIVSHQVRPFNRQKNKYGEKSCRRRRRRKGGLSEGKGMRGEQLT